MRTKLSLFIFSGLFLGLSYFLFINVSPVNSHCDIDSSAYLENAQLYLKHSSFASREVVPYYSLGYPFLIGILYKAFGSDTFSIILFQILLALLSGLLMFVVARRLFNKTVALISFFFFSINVGYLTFSQFILTEITLAFLLLLFVERATTFIKNKNLLHLAQAAFALGLSTTIKPAGMYFPLLLIPLILYTTPTQKLLNLFTFLFCFSLPVLGYMTHNHVAFGEFKTGSLAKVNLCYWLYPNVLAHQNNTTSDVERKKLQDKAKEIGFENVFKTFKTDALKQPMLFAYIWMKNVLKTWLGLFTTNLKVLVDKHVKSGQVSYFKMKGSWLQKACAYITAGTSLAWVKAVGYFEALWSILRYLLVFIALLTLLVQRKFMLSYFFTSYLFYFSMITGHDGCARFRMMFEFVLIILAARGLWTLIKACRKKHAH